MALHEAARVSLLLIFMNVVSIIYSCLTLHQYIIPHCADGQCNSVKKCISITLGLKTDESEIYHIPYTDSVEV